jgi:glycine hydroxymethyltransferase
MQAQSLEECDPELFNLIQLEKLRQFEGLELIASENFTSRAVMDCLGSCMTNKYSEGYPHHRYYGGNEWIDQVETLCQRRALAAFNVDEKEWGVNVQPYSGSPANFAVYTALLNPHDRIMGLDLPSGGHLTHGFYTAKRKVSATSIYFESFPYKVDQTTGLIDYETMRANAMVFRPKILIAGGSAYPREWDYKQMREIADACGAYLMTDMAHISGLVAAQVVDSPFAYSHIVTTTTHKSLRGPRSGVIFYSKDAKLGFETKINNAVFPALQGGPHENTIAGIATQLKQVNTPEFKAYAAQVIANSRALAASLVEYGFTLATGGSDNHLMLVDLKPRGYNGTKLQAVCDAVGLTLNKNSVYGDTSALNPGGVRVGTPALTSRGFTEEDFKRVAGFINRAGQIVESLNVAGEDGKKPKNKDFERVVASATGAPADAVASLSADIKAFASTFFMPGSDITPENYAQQRAAIVQNTPQ